MVNIEKRQKVMLKILLIIVFIVLIMIVRNVFNNPSIGELIEVNFEESKNKLTEEEYQKILKVLALNDKNDITITKIAYEVPFRHESSIYITFFSDNEKEITGNYIKKFQENEEKSTYKYEQNIFNTNENNFKMIKDVCDKYFD